VYAALKLLAGVYGKKDEKSPEKSRHKTTIYALKSNVMNEN